MKKGIVLIGVIIVILGVYFTRGFLFKPSQASRCTPGQALELIMQGHQRYLNNKNIHRDQYQEQRQALRSKQEPIAAILGCSDSRVEPAIVFDQGLGDLFVIRVAGNVCDDIVLGSIEYAVKVLHVPLVVVLGHENCGAVQATIKHAMQPESKTHVPNYIDSVVDALLPVVNKIVHQDHKPNDMLDRAVRQNVKAVAVQICEQSAIVQQALKNNIVRVVGACYDIESGKIEMLN